MSADETPAETIERLTELNNQLAQMLKRGSDRLQESARELMAQGWERGVIDAYGPVLNRHDLPPNPYRQPINLPGATE